MEAANLVSGQIPIQVALTAILGVALAALWRRRRRSVGLFLGITLGLVLIWRPDYAQTMASWAGVTRGVDVVVYSAIAALTYYVIKLHEALDSQSQTIAQLVSRLAESDFAANLGERGEES